MTTKTSKHPHVELFASSSRLACAARRAAKKNKSLAHYAVIHDVAHASTLPKVAEQTLGMVMLSHADDDQLRLTDDWIKKVFSDSFHLLLTGPTTHPDQIAQWMRETKIRSVKQLHVVMV